MHVQIEETFLKEIQIVYIMFKLLVFVAVCVRGIETAFGHGKFPLWNFVISKFLDIFQIRSIFQISKNLRFSSDLSRGVGRVVYLGI